MGATTVLMTAGLDLPKNVRGIIADCGFTSPWQILSSVFRNTLHLPAGPSLCVAEVFARVIGGFSLRQKDTRKVLKNCKVPVFIVHGTADELVPCEMTRQGFEACTGDKELYIVEGARHGMSFINERDIYKEKITAFLNRILGAAK